LRFGYTVCALGIEHNNQQSAVFTKTPSGGGGEKSLIIVQSALISSSRQSGAQRFIVRLQKVRAPSKQQNIPSFSLRVNKTRGCKYARALRRRAAAADDILKRISLMHLIYCQRTSDDFPHAPRGLLTKQNI
jgi:hypothetical protein